MGFISVDKIRQLRDAAKNGDERAKKILQMQMNGEDFSGSLDEYFKPVKEEEPVAEKPATHSNPTLQSFLEYNGVKEGDEDYDATVESFYEEYPNLRPKENVQENVQNEEITTQEEKDFLDVLIEDEIEAIEGYNKAIMEVMNLEDVSEVTKKGLLVKLEKIRSEEIEHLEELKRMKESLAKKEEIDTM